MRGSGKNVRWVLTGLLAAASAAAAATALGRPSPAFRPFEDRPVAWAEHDDDDVPKAPEGNHLQELETTLTIRDNVANEADRILAAEGSTPAQDVNAMDEVPASTWFTPRNHLHPMAVEEVARGPAFAAPVPPLKITKGKDEGAATGFQVVDARGHKFMLKLDPAGHLGLVTSAEMIGNRLFHAAGYNVPGAALVDLDSRELAVSPTATFKLRKVEKRPVTPARVAAQLGGVARLPDGRIHGAVIPWVGGEILGSFDMIGRLPSDPNDRIAHEHRRSLRASWILYAWLSILDASAINTLASYVEESGRHFVRHYLFDFSCAFGSATNYVQGPQQEGEYLVEVGRTLLALVSLGLYQRPFQAASLQNEWRAGGLEHPGVGDFPAETFDPDSYRGNRRVPAHMRLTTRDAYWGTKIVTAFSDAQIEAVVAGAQMSEGDARYVEHGLRTRRDILGRRYLRAVAAIEDPSVSPDGASMCFEDLAMDRGYAAPGEVRYLVQVVDGDGAPLATFEQAPATSRSCVLMAAAASTSPYRVVSIRERLAGGAGRPGTDVGKASRVHLRWRPSERRFVVVGLERDE